MFKYKDASKGQSSGTPLNTLFLDTLYKKEWKQKLLDGLWKSQPPLSGLPSHQSPATHFKGSSVLLYTFYTSSHASLAIETIM